MSVVNKAYLFVFAKFIYCKYEFSRDIPVTKELKILFKANILQLGCQVQMKCFIIPYIQILGRKFAIHI